MTLADGDGEATLPLGSEWELSSGSHSHVIAETRIVATEDARIPLEVWPSALLKAVVVTPAESKAQSVSVDVVTLEGQPASVPRATRFRCVFGSAKDATCAVPALARHFVMRVPGMAPHYLWDVGLRAGGTRRLGMISFRPGASFTAYLARDVAQQLREPARAALTRPIPPIASYEAARLAVPVADGRFDKRGFLQLVDIPAGTYNLTVRSRGFAPRTIGPIEIYEGKETSFRKAIELDPPVQVTISIDPPLDLAERRWTVRWEQIGAFAPAEAGVQKQADEQGQLVLSDQPSGLFSLSVLDLNGDAIWTDDIRVDAANLSIPIALDLRSLEGSITFGGEPLEATLWFGTTNGPVRVRANSNAEGRFEVRLPEGENWPVEITNDVLPIRSVVDVTIVDDSPIEIEVPDTAVDGWVVDAEGDRISRGTVVARVLGRTLTAPLTASGGFKLRGLPEGNLTLFASTPGGRSGARTFKVTMDRPIRDVELRMLRMTTLTGAVRSAGREVVGAQVSVFPLVPRTGRVVDTVSDANGSFEVEVADHAERLLVVVGAPGRTLQGFDVPHTAEKMNFEIAPHGGTIVLNFGKTPDRRLSVIRNGVELPPVSLFSWITAHGSRVDSSDGLTIPDMAPGHYRVCGVKCTDGVLAPGATVSFDLTE